MVEAHEIALDVEFDGESLFSIIIRRETDMAGKTFLPIERAFSDTARIRIGAKAAVPPFSASAKKEMMDNAVAKWGGNDFADDRIVNDESDAAAGFIITANETIAEINNIFDGI